MPFGVRECALYMLCKLQLHDRYEAASTITYCSVSLQQSPEWPSEEMKRIEGVREEETEPVWTLCPAKSCSAQLVMEKFTLCFSIDRPVNLMAKWESARQQYKLK